MAISLVKGQKIRLTKSGSGAGSGNLNRVMVGLGWDAIGGGKGGFFANILNTENADIDCDASVIFCGANGKVVGRSVNDYLVYFGNKKAFGGAVAHGGDNLTGEGEGDDEVIQIDLNKIPSQVQKLVFVVNIYSASSRKQHFGMIKNAFIRLVDCSSGKEICKYLLNEEYTGMEGMIFAEIYRRNDEWKFNAIGQPVRKASSVRDILETYM